MDTNDSSTSNTTLLDPPVLTVENGGAPAPSIETDSEGFIGRDLFSKATKKPPRTKVVTFPEHTAWAGAKMRIKEIRAGEKSKVNASVVKGKAGDNTIDTSEQDARLIIAACINKDGTQQFSEKNDLAMVMAMPSSCSEFLVEEIRKLFDKPEKKDGEGKEDELGNSTSTASSN